MNWENVVILYCYVSDSTSCDIGDNVCWDLQNCYCFYEVILCLTLYWLIIFSIRFSPLILTIPPIEIKGKMHKLSMLFIPRFYTRINGNIILINKLTVSSVTNQQNYLFYKKCGYPNQIHNPRTFLSNVHIMLCCYNSVSEYIDVKQKDCAEWFDWNKYFH